MIKYNRISVLGVKYMELNKDNIIEIFKKNFKYEIVDTILGKAIKMDWYNAFIYCNVTGAGYLDNPVLPYTPKGMMKIFYNAFDFNFVTGLFEKTDLKNTPRNLSEIKDFMFKGDKYILLEEFNKEVELIDRLYNYMDILKENNIDCTDFIIQRIETSKNGNGMESFMEYIACEVYKRNGFIVENQIPLAHNVGSPDFGGYSLKNIINYLNRKKLLGNGFHIIELAMLKLKNTKDFDEQKEYIDNKAIVGEAKTSTKIMESQLRKYLNTGLFEYGVELHPDKATVDSGEFALITFDKDFNIVMQPPKSKKEIVNSDFSKEDYYKWLEIYMKFYIIANLNNDELNAFYKRKMKTNINNTIDIVEFISSVSIEEIINKIFKGEI